MKHLLALICTLCLVNAVSAVLVINIQETGSDVIATGSGTANLTNLSLTYSTSDYYGQIFPPVGTVLIGSNSNESAIYESISGPAGFGTGGISFSTGTGDFFGISGGNSITVPQDYITGSSLSGTATWANTDLETLGVTPGSYTWTWGNGANADSLTVNVGAVPEPSTYAALAGLAALGLALFRKRRK